MPRQKVMTPRQVRIVRKLIKDFDEETHHDTRNPNSEELNRVFWYLEGKVDFVRKLFGFRSESSLRKHVGSHPQTHLIEEW